MPLIIPKTLPAYDALYNENVFVMHRERALSQHIRPLEILILNLSQLQEMQKSAKVRVMPINSPMQESLLPEKETLLPKKQALKFFRQL